MRKKRHAAHRCGDPCGLNVSMTRERNGVLRAWHWACSNASVVAMRMLITWGSKRGGTEGIARMLGEALQQEGHHVDLLPSGKAARATGFDAVVVGVRCTPIAGTARPVDSWPAENRICAAYPCG